MRSTRESVRKMWGTAAAVLVLALVSALPQQAAAQTPSLDPRYTTLYPYVGGRHTTCFWYYGPVSGGAGDLNIAYPDANAYYWAAYFRRPAGSTLKLRGRFPHTRYFSIVSYNAQSAILDGIYDAQLEPDADGSANPFRPGADRNASLRNYTINVRNAVNPGFPVDRVYNDQAPRNDFYARSNPNSSETLNGVAEDLELLMWRTYGPDQGADSTGDVGLPDPELTLADGTVLTGQALCDRVDSESRQFFAANVRLRLTDPNSLLINKAAWQALRYPDALSAGCNVLNQTGCPVVPPQSYPPVLPQQPASAPLVQRPWDAATKGPLPPYFPATLPNTWRATYTRRYLLQMYTGNDAPGAETAPIRFTGGVFFPNPHNNYARTVVNRKLGKVAVFRGKMPVTPTTFRNDATWTTDPIQARYVSYCISESLRTTRVMDCTYDELMPIDDDRRFTLAVSRIEDRPANATKFCGVSWLEWWPTGDGAIVMGDDKVDLDFGWLGIRHMLPERSFAQAIQNTQTPGDERAVMGDYLPVMSYEADAAAFEQNVGCAWAQPGRPTLAAGSVEPNTGSFDLRWAPTRDAGQFPGLRYALQRKNASGSWGDVDTSLTAAAYTVSGESEGTWTYQVRASEGTATSSWSAPSRDIKVDLSAPRVPTASLSRPPDYAGAGGWYADSVLVTFADDGDVVLADGSPGSGIDLASLPAPTTVNVNGMSQVSGRVRDLVGHESDAVTVTVQVDAQAPSLSSTCPPTALLHASVAATISASDGESGLVSDPSGSTAIDTSTVGAKVTSSSATDHVGHTASASCTTQVRYAYSGLLQPVNGDGSSIFKLGSTVPLKFRLSDAMGAPVSGATALLSLAQLAQTVQGSELEAAATVAVDGGSTFRETEPGSYQFNLETKGLSVGTWQVTVGLDDGTRYSLHISLR